MIRTTLCAVVFASFIAASGSRSVHAKNKIHVGSRVASRQQVSMDVVDHSAWNVILRKYVNGDGMVDYRALQASSVDVQTLDAYLRTLSTASLQIRASNDGKLAFWINAYNAVTVRGILREYPTTSIRNHTAKVFGYNIWKDLLLYVGGQPFSLEQIEHEQLRKMNEPRIHFAIVCASIGCPRLLNEAYVADRVIEQLETNSRDFFARPQNFRFDEPNRRFYVSSILSWFGKDFGSDQAAQLRKIASWLPSESARDAAARNTVRVSFLGYNWNINDQTNPRTSRR